MKTIAFIFSVLTLLSFNSYSQKNGKYLQRDFESIEYKAHPQNTTIVRDKRGIMYFSNFSGVLEYDGINWRLIPIENNSPTLSLGIDSLGIIYAGGFNCFGYLAPDESGKLQYKSLSAELDSTHKNFGNIWRIGCANSETYFMSMNKMFRHNFKAKEKFKVYECNSSFTFPINVNGTIYSSIKNDRIIKFENDEMIFIDNTEEIAKDILFIVLPWEDDNILFGSRTFAIYDPQKKTDNIVPYRPVNNDFFTNNMIYGAENLEDDKIFYYTLVSGCVITNRAGKIISYMNTETNLKTNVSYHAKQYPDQPFWLAASTGITRIEMNSPITFWDKNIGINSRVYNVVEFQGEKFILATGGIYRYNADNNNFKILKSTKI